MPSGCQPFLTRRFELALQFASGLHHSQCRKGTPIPYISHLMAVSALVLESGGDEDLAIAALLHDAVEGQGGAPTLQIIRRMLGDRVANVVMECSDTDREPKPPWRERKEQYLAHLLSARAKLGPVGAAKALHALAPTFFPMWDNEIARGYGVSTEGGYFQFMLLAKRQLVGLPADLIPSLSLVKAFDEYNYYKFSTRRTRA